MGHGRMSGSSDMTWRKIFRKAMDQVGCLIEAPTLYEYMTADANLRLAFEDIIGRNEAENRMST